MDADHCDVYPRNIPSVDTFTNHARAAGVNNSSHVVVYSDTDIHGYLVSGRGWWTFKVILQFLQILHLYTCNVTQSELNRNDTNILL